MPGRSVEAVSCRAGRLGLHLTERRLEEPVRESKPWTAAEDDVIKDAVESGAATLWEEIADRLPGRTKSAVKKRGRGLGLQLSKTRAPVPWSEEEDAALREAVAEGANSWEEVAEAIASRDDSAPDRGAHAVKQRGHRLGLFVRLPE